MRNQSNIKNRNRTITASLGYLLMVCMAGIVIGAGCSRPINRMELATYASDGTTGQHYIEFTRASYQKLSADRVELVLQADEPSTVDPTQNVTQILHLKNIWVARPGRTHAESSQINATAELAILSPPTGIRYDGGAFITYHIDSRTGELNGEVEYGTLVPHYRMGHAVEPFGPARFKGYFRARHRPSDVVDVLHQLATQFTQSVDSPR